MEKPKNVDEFIENAVNEAQPIIIELRKMIKEAFLDIEEKIGYGVPQYKCEKATFGISVAKKHVTLGFDYGVISDEIRKELEDKKYKLGLQTLQIKFNQDIPKVEIQKVFDGIKNSF